MIVLWFSLVLFTQLSLKENLSIRQNQIRLYSTVSRVQSKNTSLQTCFCRNGRLHLPILYSTILPKNVIYVINILFKIGTQVFQATAQTSFKSDFHFVQSAPLIATEAESAFTIGFTAACSLWRPPLLAGGKRFTPAAAAASVSMFIYVNTRCPPQPNDCLHAWGTILPASGFYRSFS